MTYALVLLPDFVLIMLGFLICRYSALGRPVWEAAERLVYYLLFPALLFSAIVRNPLQPAEALPLAGAGWIVTGVGIALAYTLHRWPSAPAGMHASGAQVAFRFNSYVALAVVERVAVGLAVVERAAARRRRRGQRRCGRWRRGWGRQWRGR